MGRRNIFVYINGQEMVRMEQAKRWRLSWRTRRYPGDPAMQISHETIYRSLFVQARGVLKKELVEHLRTRRAIRYHSWACGPPARG